jgi:hypothetical protein
MTASDHRVSRVYRVSRHELATKSDVEIAAWHAARLPEGVEVTLAEREAHNCSLIQRWPRAAWNAIIALVAALLGLMVGYTLNISNPPRDISPSQLQVRAARYRALLIKPTSAEGIELKLDRGSAQPVSDQPLGDRPAVLM